MNMKNVSHPRVLPFLCLTETWERFGFYVVQGLLVLFMAHHFGYSDSESYTILGIFTALAYISPLIGGYLASRVIGFKTAILWGGAFLVIGYALLALPYEDTLFYPALAAIVVGNGLFKPNISSLLGAQYNEQDPRRDSGFTIFYIGINLGALLAGLTSGYIKDFFGWQVTFGLASAGLVIGLVTFIYGSRYLKKELVHKVMLKNRLLVYCVLAAVGINFLLKLNFLATWLLPLVGILLLVYLTVLTAQQNPADRQRMLMLNILIISSIVFWMLFLQIFYSANLFVDRLVEKQLFGIPLSTTVFYATESMFVILLGPAFAWTWQTLGHNNKNPSPIHKFTLGIFFAGLGFLVLSAGTWFPNDLGMIHPAWVFFAYLLITIGELLLSPIGLSAVTMLAPAHLTGLMMGVWFVAYGFGGVFAGLLAQLSNVSPEINTTAGKLAIYQHAFLTYAYIAFFVAITLFLMQATVRKYLRRA